MPQSQALGRFTALQRAALGSRHRFLLRLSFTRCNRCGERPIDILFDEYLSKRRSKCVRCALLVSLLNPLIDLAMRALGVDVESFKRAIMAPHWRKGIIATIKGVAYFGLRKPLVSCGPFFVVWNFTNRCNLRCRHCYQDAGRPLPDELTTEEALRVVKELSDFDVSSIAFSGGEPLVRRDFFTVVEYARNCGMYVSVATNGVLISREVAKKLSKTVHYVQVSIDGSTPEFHDAFRGVKGSWNRAVAGINHLVDEGVTVGIAATATRGNLGEIFRIVELAERLKADFFICFNFIPTGRGKEILESDLTPAEREELLEGLYRRLVQNMAGKKKLQLYCTSPQFARVGLEMQRQMMREICAGFGPVIPATHYANLPGLTLEMAEFIGGCGAGRVYAALSPEGDVQPCVFMPIKLGNLRRERFEDIWLHSPILNELRDRENLKGGCGACRYKYVCGGCRARAYGYFGDYLMHDPGCVLSLEDKSSITASASEAIM
ncbi:MAG: radical SAM protein [Nitrososphaerota archaeon]